MVLFDKSPQILVFLVLIWNLCLIFTAASSPPKVLVGRTGVGKSYIASALGCDVATCSGEISCTRNIHICKEQGVWDTVGFDDFINEEHIVMYNGKEISLTGLSFPMYLLMDKMEEEKVAQVEFYLVVDSNNMREGESSQLFKKITSLWECPITRVLNKHRPGSSLQRDLKLQPGDITVGEDQHDITLTGVVCSIGLVSNWRELIVKQDIIGVKALIDIAKCKSTKKAIAGYQEILDQREIALPTPPEYEPIPNRSCTHIQVVEVCSGFWIFEDCDDMHVPYTDAGCLDRLNNDQEAARLRNKILADRYAEDLTKATSYNSDLNNTKLKTTKLITIATIEFAPCEELVNLNLE